MSERHLPDSFGKHGPKNDEVQQQDECSKFYVSQSLQEKWETCQWVMTLSAGWFARLRPSIVHFVKQPCHLAIHLLSNLSTLSYTFLALHNSERPSFYLGCNCACDLLSMSSLDITWPREFSINFWSWNLERVLMQYITILKTRCIDMSTHIHLASNNEYSQNSLKTATSLSLCAWDVNIAKNY